MTQATMPAMPSAIKALAPGSFFFTLRPKAETGWVVSLTGTESSVASLFWQEGILGKLALLVVFVLMTTLILLSAGKLAARPTDGMTCRPR